MMKTTLEQWQLLQAVVALGSYQKAAERFNRTQSSVSYQLAMLQERLGLSLLTIVGRKAELTDVGKDLLLYAQIVLDGMSTLEAKAEAFRRGERVRIDLVVDSIFPKPLLFSLLESFHVHHPKTQIHVTEVVRSESMNQLAQHSGDLYLIHLPASARHRGKLIMEITFIAVVCKAHPLLLHPQPLQQLDLARFPLIRIVDRETLKHTAAETGDYWSFTSVEAAIEAVRHGVGYGWLPESHIRTLLASGELCRLPLQSGGQRRTSIYLVKDASLEQNTTVDALIQELIVSISDG